MLQHLKSSFKSALLKLLRKFKIYHKISGVPIGEASLAQVINDVELILSKKIAPEKNILPLSLNEQINAKFAFYNNLDPFENFVIKAKNWRIWGNQGAVITAQNYLFKDVSREYDNPKHSIFEQVKLQPDIAIKETLAVLAASGAEVYYHWMLDILPRINLLKESKLIDDIDKFVINFSHLNFQKETLERAGIAESKIMQSVDHWNFHVAAQTLIIPSLPSPINRPSLESALYLRSLFSKEINNDVQEKRIYVQRARGRTIINEEELLAVLRPLNFEIIDLEELSVADQASLFSKAEIVIGPHGSGFTNIAFCKPKTVIIDLFSPLWVNPCFWILSNHLQLKYAYLIGKSNTVNANEINKGANMHIEVEDFKAILKKAWIN